MKTKLSAMVMALGISVATSSIAGPDIFHTYEETWTGKDTYSTIRHYTQHQKDLGKKVSALYKAVENFAIDDAARFGADPDDLSVKSRSYRELGCKQNGPYRRAQTKLTCEVQVWITLRGIDF